MPHEEPEENVCLEEPEELPRRPRRRLLGAGGNPIALALFGALLIACGFIGGVLVEKGETSSGSATGSVASPASRFRALRGGTSGAGTSANAGAAGGSPGSSSGFTRPTAGTVAYLAGSTLYVTNSEGNTVKVTTSPGTTVSKTVKASLKGIHPGETVTVTGETGPGGALSAEAISVGSSAGGGLLALFGGGSSAGGSSGRGSGSGPGASGSGSGGASPLFGSG